MKISEMWLREWVDPAITVEQLAEQLTMAGLEVDAIESCLGDFSGVIVANVTAIEKHPASDGLSVCRLNIGKDEVAVVCGADNVHIGGRFPYAGPGAKLPGARVINVTTIKGVESRGMLCSGAELGLSEDAEGLMLLDQSAVPGADLRTFLGLEDNTIEISLTPNRGDCFSILGIAREVAVLNRMDLNRDLLTPVAVESGAARVITLPEPAACPVYAGRVIEGVDLTRQTPTWLEQRLRRSGLRPINPAVDVTNYVMLELGQPMHAFDNDRLDGAISVRYAHAGETLTLLDEQSYKLTGDTLIIADDSGPIAMAGIMGGDKSAVNTESCNLFLESAFFSPMSITGRARRYGLHTDASQRFERGVDYELQSRALEHATRLIIDICGGKAGPQTVKRRSEALPTRRGIRLRAEKIRSLLGIEIAQEQTGEILRRLGMQVTESGEYWDVVAPSYRFDMEIEVDLIEELARIHGYDSIPTTAPHASMTIVPGETDQSIDYMRNVLVNRGYYEAITYSFVDNRLQSMLCNSDAAIELLNPISAELGVMRQSLWPGLLSALEYNLKRQQQRVRLFEYGRKFNLEPELVQEPVIAGLCYGKNYPEQWDKLNNSCDFYDIKGDVEAILNIAGLKGEISYREIEHPALHPGQSAGVFLDDRELGVLGALHPRLLRELDIKKPVFVFELYVSRFSSGNVVKYKKISKFPSVKRDISILLDEKIPVDRVLKCIHQALPDYLENLELFDLFQGEGIDLGKKSLALGLTFQGSSSTLIDEEVKEMMDKVRDRLHSEIGATLRE